MSLAVSPSPRAAEPNTQAYSGPGRQEASSSRIRRQSSVRRSARSTANRRRDVVPIELMNLIAPHQGCSDETLLHQSCQAAAYADLRSADGLLGHLPDGQGLPSSRENRQHRAIKGPRDGTCRIR